MCACILHNLLIEHSSSQDCLDGNNLELDEEDEFNQPAKYSHADKRHSQIFAFMLEVR